MSEKSSVISGHGVFRHFIPQYDGSVEIKLLENWRRAHIGEFEILINIQTLEVIQGKMPKRALILIMEWALDHRDELLEDWNLCTQNKMPNKILPLE